MTPWARPEGADGPGGALMTPHPRPISPSLLQAWALHAHPCAPALPGSPHWGWWAPEGRCLTGLGFFLRAPLVAGYVPCGLRAQGEARLPKARVTPSVCL